MPRTGEPPAPVDPSAISTREEFAAALTTVRQRAGFSVRALAQALATPTATIGDYCSGRHLPGPGQQQLFAEMLQLCGVSAAELEAWRAAVARLRVGSDARMRRVAAPYQGLAPFEVADRDRFFGREAMTNEVLQRLRDQVAGSETPGLVLVVGASGAGKSSLLRAGVQARIQEEGLGPDRAWAVTLFTPGDEPIEALHACAAKLPAGPRAVIIDQLEEVLVAAAAVRERFLEEVTHLAVSGTSVVAGLRADYFEQAVRTPVLRAALRANPVLLAPMTEPELRRAILEPARVAGVQVDDGLVELLMADLSPRDAAGTAHDPGALPLLSHALLQTWERAQGNRLTVADYRASGGLHGAVSQTAEALFTQLDHEQQSIARRVFMRLVRVASDGPTTRRRAPRQELAAIGRRGKPGPANDTDGVVDAVIDRFVQARLMTVSTDTVEFSHDSLLSAWPRLANWIEQNRDGLRIHRLLTEASNEWVAGGRASELLLRESRLQLIGQWAQMPENQAELNADERAYLHASQKRAQQRRRAARRRARQLRVLLSASVLSALAALALAAVALHARDVAARARDDALSRQVALQSAAVAPTDPSLAMQLAVLAHRIAPTINATSALLSTSDGEMPTRLLGPTGPTFLTVAAQAPRLAVAYSAAAEIRVYDDAEIVPRLEDTIRAMPSSAQIFAVSLSPNGQLLAAGGTNHAVTVWSLRTGLRPKQIGTLPLPAGTVYQLAFSPDGRWLAAVDDGQSVYLWSVHSGRIPQIQETLRARSSTQLRALQFFPAGGGLAAAGTSGVIELWRSVAPRTKPRTIAVPGTPTLNALSFDPAGTTLAAGGTDNLVHRWALSGHSPPRALASLHGFTSWVQSLAFSPTGKQLAAGSSDSSLRVWSTPTAPDTVLEHPAPVTGAVFIDHGSRLVSTDSAGTLRSWTIPAPSTNTAPGKIFGLDYTSNGNELAVISSGPQGDAQLWNTTDAARPRLIANVSPKSFGAVAGAGAITADGKLLAIANDRAQVRIIDISHPRHPRPVGPILTGATPYIEQMTFDPTRRLLAASDDAGHIDLWDLTSPAHPVREPTLNDRSAPQIMLGVAFSPNGRLLASASTNGHVALWNVTRPSHPRFVAVVGHLTGYAYSVAFTPNGRILAAGGADQAVHLWNVQNPARPTPIGGPLTGPTSIVYDIAINPTGKRVAAATTDGTVWLWDIRNPAKAPQFAALPASSTDLYAVSFQPHRDMLIAGGTDQQLHLWDDNPGALAATICREAGTPLTRTEWAQYVQTNAYTPPCR